MFWHSSELLTTFKLIYFLIVFIAFFLSLWIIIPASNLYLIRLSVGVPEISPGIILIQTITLIISIVIFQPHLWFQLLILVNFPKP